MDRVLEEGGYEMDPILAERFGDRITDDRWERITYGRDLAEVPGIFRAFLQLKTVPDLVVRPISTEDVAAVLQYAEKRNIPVIPRGSGSSAFFNSVPINKGITVDLSGLSGIEDLDEENEVVTVGAGQRWEDLDKKLRTKGWAICSYPSSAPTATVGGWLNMEGYGIGSLAFGSLLDQVAELEVVLADGSIRSVSRDTTPALSWFAGSDGTLGIVTKVSLKIRRMPSAESHWLISFQDAETLSKAARILAQASPRPYNMGYFSLGYFEFLSRFGHVVPEGEILAVDFEGDPSDILKGEEVVHRVVKEFSAVLVPQELVQVEWEERFYHMRIKRFGPTLMAAEDWLPIQELGPYQERIARLGKNKKTKFYSYGTFVNSEKMTLFTAYRADARQGLGYIVAMALTGSLHRLAIQLGGHPYSVGFWNTPYLPSIYSQDTLNMLKERKQQLDPKGILNPGKHYKYPTLLPPWFFTMGTGVASLLQRFTGPKE